MEDKMHPECELSRRDFLKISAFLGGSGLLAGLGGSQLLSTAASAADADSYGISKPESVLYTVCLQCNTGCGIKAKIENGVATKIDGSPFSPWTLTPHVPYATSPFATAAVDTPLCPKGQSGVQTVYDPYRIVKVLKRAGKRGEGKWKSVPFEQAISEIVEGGLLFKDVPGEENRKVEGFKDIYVLKDAAVAKAMGADATKVAKKQMTLEEFKAKHKDNLDKLIDPDHPDLGPKNNQFVFAWGRMKAGRSDMVTRFVKDAFGSANAHGHTTVCQGSLYFTGKAMSEQFTDGKWTGGKKFYWQADTGNSEFIIFVGASPFEGNYGPPLRSGKITDGLSSGKLKIAVVDPRLSKTAAKAWKWLPIQPGTEGAMALAMVRWVIDNKKYDERFLKNANQAAAAADKEASWCNAGWLVKLDKDGVPGKYLRASEIGVATEKRKAADGTEYDFDRFVVMADGKPVAFDPYDQKNGVEGELLVSTEINGIMVKSGMQILADSAFSRTIEEWAKICDLEAADIVELAREFTSHGKKAAADVHRGVSQHTNGFYNVFAWYALNLLIGNFDWKGGMSQLATYDQAGTKAGKPFNLSALHPKKAATWGISIIRHDTKYDETTLFSGYPAKRPFYPLSSDIYQEIVPSIGDAYPYPVKALMLYMGSPVYSLPAGNTNIDVLSDPAKLPLFIASDIVIGETSMYADYIFPDLSYLERWEFHGSHPSIPQKVQPARQPVIAPLVETGKVFGQELPISLEALMMGIAEKLSLPGFGKNGFG
ncbi:MAG: molybdopterin-dependent oxidoreductase, partial [Chloroflexota bacterium]